MPNVRKSSSFIFQGTRRRSSVLQPGFSKATELADMRRHFRNLHKAALLHENTNVDLLDDQHGEYYTTQVNGEDVGHPNFNDDTPAAPAGYANVTFQKDDDGNVSAYGATGDVTGPASATICNAACFAATDGKSIQDSGVPTSKIVQSDGDFTNDNRLIKTDRPSSDNRKVQQTGITVDDSNNVTGVVNLNATGVVTAIGDTKTAQGSNPGGTTTLWANSGDGDRFYQGANKLAYSSEITGGGSGDMTAEGTDGNNFAAPDLLLVSNGNNKTAKDTGIYVDPITQDMVSPADISAQRFIADAGDAGMEMDPVDAEGPRLTDAGGDSQLRVQLGQVLIENKLAVTTLANFGGGVRFAINTPANITGDQTDYAGFNAGTFQRANPTGATRTINSIVGPTGDAGSFLVVVNIGSVDLVFLEDDGATGTASCRIITGLGANYTLGPDQTAVLWYDYTSSRWRIWA
jgi:hypothetical protein